MSELTKEDLQTWGREKPSGWINLPKQVGEDVIFTITKATKNHQINDPKKFSVKDKDGTPLGFNWRFTVSDGRAWDVNKTSLFGPCLAWLYPDGDVEKPTPVTIRLFRKSEKKTERESIYGVKLAEEKS